MLPFQRMKRLYPLKPQVKKGKDPLPLKVPQYVGTPGWIYLTHNERSEPTALFIDAVETVTPVPLILDERLFSDTVLRVTRLSKDVYVVCDLRYLNGLCVFETMSYTQRQERIATLLELFHHPDLTALIGYDGVPANTSIRGWETYDIVPGTLGVFIPTDT